MMQKPHLQIFRRWFFKRRKEEHLLKYCFKCQSVGLFCYFQGRCWRPASYLSQGFHVGLMFVIPLGRIVKSEPLHVFQAPCLHQVVGGGWTSGEESSLLWFVWRKCRGKRHLLPDWKTCKLDKVYISSCFPVDLENLFMTQFSWPHFLGH